MNCLICGSPIKNKYNDNYALVGRPKYYCSDACRDYYKYFNAFQKSLSQIKLDDKHKRKIRGEMFRVANTIKINNSRTFGTDILSVEN